VYAGAIYADWRALLLGCWLLPNFDRALLDCNASSRLRSIDTKLTRDLRCVYDAVYADWRALFLGAELPPGFDLGRALLDCILRCARRYNVYSDLRFVYGALSTLTGG
jgi:hypothetical protein